MEQIIQNLKWEVQRLEEENAILTDRDKHAQPRIDSLWMQAMEQEEKIDDLQACNENLKVKHNHLVAENARLQAKLEEALNKVMQVEKQAASDVEAARAELAAQLTSQRSHAELSMEQAESLQHDNSRLKTEEKSTLRRLCNVEVDNDHLREEAVRLDHSNRRLELEQESTRKRLDEVVLQMASMQNEVARMNHANRVMEVDEMSMSQKLAEMEARSERAQKEAQRLECANRRMELDEMSTSKRLFDTEVDYERVRKQAERLESAIRGLELDEASTSKRLGNTEADNERLRKQAERLESANRRLEFGEMSASKRLGDTELENERLRRAESREHAYLQADVDEESFMKRPRSARVQSETARTQDDEEFLRKEWLYLDKLRRQWKADNLGLRRCGGSARAQGYLREIHRQLDERTHILASFGEKSYSSDNSCRCMTPRSTKPALRTALVSNSERAQSVDTVDGTAADDVHDWEVDLVRRWRNFLGSELQLKRERPKKASSNRPMTSRPSKASSSGGQEYIGEILPKRPSTSRPATSRPIRKEASGDREYIDKLLRDSSRPQSQFVGRRLQDL